eukprot:12000479-Alexandrium_andersonii.AAC.1
MLLCPSGFAGAPTRLHKRAPCVLPGGTPSGTDDHRECNRLMCARAQKDAEHKVQAQCRQA